MSVQELTACYLELEALSKQALASLRNGFDAAALSPLFERKAALGGLIAAQEPGRLGSDPEALQALLEAQARASKIESELAQVLQAFVSSNGTRPSKGPLIIGQRWDLKG